MVEGGGGGGGCVPASPEGRGGLVLLDRDPQRKGGEGGVWPALILGAGSAWEDASGTSPAISSETQKRRQLFPPAQKSFYVSECQQTIRFVCCGASICMLFMGSGGGGGGTVIRTHSLLGRLQHLERNHYVILACVKDTRLALTENHGHRITH